MTQITQCRFCGLTHGPLCPEVKALEYYPDGSMKRVEFKGVADKFLPQQTVQSYPVNNGRSYHPVDRPSQNFDDLRHLASGNVLK